MEPALHHRDSPLWRRLALLLLGLWLITAAVALRIHLETRPAPPLVEPAAEAPPVRLRLVRATFQELPGWREDPVAEALPALHRSCAVLGGRPGETEVGPEGSFGRAADWAQACAALPPAGAGDEALRRGLEAAWVPFATYEDRRRTGLYTGYFEPLLRGSRRRHGPYDVPLYRRPPDLVSVDLGEFRPHLAGERLAGRVEGGRLEPYPDRARIQRGALAGRGLELLWVDDPVDAFFLHIQGSGRVELAEGGVLRVGYAGQNGHPYFAVGRELIHRGALVPEEVSLQSIRAWLAEHPDQAAELLALNPSYVFFRELPGDGPLGSQGVVLTPERSLAVDRRFLPLGAPMWVELRTPHSDPGEPDRLLRRLLVAQDTGGAIRGPLRGDVFWGAGDEAASVAGRMRHRGRAWLLLPAAVVARPAREADRPGADRPGALERQPPGEG